MMLQGLVPARKDVFFVSEYLPRYLPQEDLFYGGRSCRRVIHTLRCRRAGEAGTKVTASDRRKPSECNSPLKHSVFAFRKIRPLLFLLTSLCRYFLCLWLQLDRACGGAWGWTCCCADRTASCSLLLSYCGRNRLFWRPEIIARQPV